MTELDGFKITYDQIEHNSPVVEMMVNEPKLKIIFLERNKIESAISYWFAIKSQKWQADFDELPTKDEEDYVNYSFVKNFCETAHQDTNYYREVFAKHDIFNIQYDDLISDWAGVTSRLQEFLLVKNYNLPIVFSKRLKRPLTELVLNYSSLTKIHP